MTENMVSSSPVMPPLETTPALPVSEVKKPGKILYILGGVAAILVSLALGITFFSRSSSPTSPDTTGEQADAPPGYSTYINTPYFYSLALPPKWNVIETTPDQKGSVLIQTDEPALIEIESFKATTSNLEEYFGTLQDGRSSSKSNPVKVGDYDGIERFESWPNTSLQPVVTYTQIQDQVYIFRLLPAGGKNAISSESLLKEYRNILSTFKISVTSELGKDWKTFRTSQVEGNSFGSFTFKHPQSWAVTEKSENKNLLVSIYRNNYEIAITQAPIGAAVCLFKDSPDFSGSSGDLRSKDYLEFETDAQDIMRRYFNANQGEKSTFYFCQKESSSPYFATPTGFGGIVYYVPAKYDDNILKEMDSIIKTFALTTLAPSPTPASASATTP
jgi:hypothetical protein